MNVLKSRWCPRMTGIIVLLVGVAFFVLPRVIWDTSLLSHVYIRSPSFHPSLNFKSISAQSLGQMVSSLGQEYSSYADRIVADSVSGATVEFIFEQNYKAGVDNLLLDLGVQRYAHRTVLKQKILEWRESFRLLNEHDAQLYLSKINEPNPLAKAGAAPCSLSPPAQGTAASVTGPQVARVFQFVQKHVQVCPAPVDDSSASAGIPKEQADWYESAYEDGVKQAAEANNVVSDTAVGNGWEYSDNDILGMVHALSFEVNDSVLDVGCGDGYFLERLLRLLPQLKLQAMGVDLMPFSINTARARFLRLGIEFFDSKTSMNRHDAFPVPCVGSSCSCAVFPVACVGSGLQMPWLQQGSFNKYISVYPINHFDDEGSEKLICESYRVLRPGGIAFFGMINRDEGTFLGPHFRNESWWPAVASRCGFESLFTTSNYTEWRGGPKRYHVYLRKGQ